MNTLPIKFESLGAGELNYLKSEFESFRHEQEMETFHESFQCQEAVDDFFIDTFMHRVGHKFLYKFFGINNVELSYSEYDAMYVIQAKVADMLR